MSAIADEENGGAGRVFISTADGRQFNNTARPQENFENANDAPPDERPEEGEHIGASPKESLTSGGRTPSQITLQVVSPNAITMHDSLRSGTAPAAGDDAPTVSGRFQDDLSSSVEHSAPETETAPERAKNPRHIEVLRCSICYRPIASVNEILHEHEKEVFRDHVFAYELDLFGNENPIWTYSATNSALHRFDVVRVKPKVATNAALLLRSKRLPYELRSGRELSLSDYEAVPWMEPEVSFFEFRGFYSSEHSFFTGYEWCYCNCAGCLNFLGWGFVSQEKVEAQRSRLKEQQQQQPSEEDTQEQATAPSVDPGVNPGSSVGVSRCKSHTTPEMLSLIQSNAISPEVLAPDFVGIIVTNCTGRCDYSREQFNRKACRLGLRNWKTLCNNFHVSQTPSSSAFKGLSMGEMFAQITKPESNYQMSMFLLESSDSEHSECNSDADAEN